MQKPKKYKSVLTIAGSDSSGGAGIQADIKTISALGCYAAAVISSLTAQNTQGVTAIHTLPADFLAAQLDAVFDDIEFSAIKIGMLHQIDSIEVVAEKLAAHKNIAIVVDPVMTSKSGCKLITNEAQNVLKKILLPLATLITPNLDEAEILLARRIDSLEQMQIAANDLAAEYRTNILLKGGHLSGHSCVDVLVTDTNSYIYEAPRVETNNTHGTGCTLSSAIASYLALGFLLPEAVQAAKNYLTRAISAGKDYQLGHGHGPVKHFLNAE